MYSVIGLKEVNFTAKDGKNIVGTRLYLTYEDEDCEGFACEAIYMPVLISQLGVCVGDTIDVIYNKYGKVSRIDIK